VFDFFNKLFKPPAPSGATAKERLRLVLLSDHLSLAPDVIDALKHDLLTVISRYVEIDGAHADVTFEHREGEVAMLASIPIRGMRERVRNEAPPAPLVAQAPPAPLVAQAPPAPLVAQAPPAPLVAQAPPAPPATATLALEAPPAVAAAVAEASVTAAPATAAPATAAPAVPRRRRRRKSAAAKRAAQQAAAPAVQFNSPAQA
jgi:cell division topological specificity factor